MNHQSAWGLPDRDFSFSLFFLGYMVSGFFSPASCRYNFFFSFFFSFMVGSSKFVCLFCLPYPAMINGSSLMITPGMSEYWVHFFFHFYPTFWHPQEDIKSGSHEMRKPLQHQTVLWQKDSPCSLKVCWAISSRTKYMYIYTNPVCCQPLLYAKVIQPQPLSLLFTRGPLTKFNVARKGN